jgi:hypothetical protein
MRQGHACGSITEEALVVRAAMPDGLGRAVERLGLGLSAGG